jgi:DNA-binding phage protein
MTRAGLYKALGKGGNPSFGAVLKVIRAMGLEFHIAPQK